MTQKRFFRKGTTAPLRHPGAPMARPSSESRRYAVFRCLECFSKRTPRSSLRDTAEDDRRKSISRAFLARFIKRSDISSLLIRGGGGGGGGGGGRWLNRATLRVAAAGSDKDPPNVRHVTARAVPDASQRSPERHRGERISCARARARPYCTRCG
jgi:hypothetical protein